MRALLSVANRDGISSLARDLLDLGTEVYATDGTRESLAADGVEVHAISELISGQPIPSSLVKTLHPEIYAGILAPRHLPDDLEKLAAQGIEPIDLVVVNVKPFAPQVRSGVVPIDQAIEMIDVAGMALLSAAARNYAGVSAVSDPSQYATLVEEVRRLGQASPELRQRLAADAFAVVAAYNAEVAGYLNHIGGTRFPDKLTVVLEKKRDLLYGENPHQRAAFYRETTHRTRSLADATQLQGSEPDLQRPARPRCRVPDRGRLRRHDRLDRQADQPGRAGVQRLAGRGLPPGARGRPGERLRSRHRQQPHDRRGDGRRDRGQRLRGGRGARPTRTARSRS